MSKPYFKIDFNFKVNMKHYKSFLRKLKTFLQYSATVGIHAKDGKQKVIRRYTTMSKKGKEISHKAGKSHRMTIAKLAYQNEFGAEIYIKPRYKTVTKKTKKYVHTLKARLTTSTIEKYSALRGAKEQGYLLLDKTGKFVAYFKPESKIKIPKRSFIRKVITDKDPMLANAIQDVLASTFVRGGYTAKSGITKIAKLVQYKMKNGMKNTQPNHPLTFKAKGHRTPLIDEQDRLAKAIKFKIYKNAFVKGTKSNLDYTIQKNIKTIDRALATISQFDTINREFKDLGIVNIKEYKRFNPNFEFIDYYK